MSEPEAGVTAIFAVSAVGYLHAFDLLLRQHWMRDNP